MKSKGSNAELRTQIYISAELGEIPALSIKPIIQESKEISAMLQGLIQALQREDPKP